MGSSSDGDYPAPDLTSQPVHYTQAPPAQPPQVPSFTPNAPGQVASGLDQSHFDAIAAYDAANRKAIEDMYRGQAGTADPAAAEGGTGDPAKAELARMLLAELMGRAPMNRPGGRMPWDEEQQAYVRNPDWLPTNRAGMRADRPSWGGSLAGKLA